MPQGATVAARSPGEDLLHLPTDSPASELIFLFFSVIYMNELLPKEFAE